MVSLLSGLAGLFLPYLLLRTLGRFAPSYLAAFLVKIGLVPKPPTP